MTGIIIMRAVQKADLQRGRGGPPAPYRLLLLRPVHLEAVEGVALPVLVQLPDHHGLHSLQKGCEPGAIVLGRGWRARRHRGLGLHLSICTPPGLRGRVGGWRRWPSGSFSGGDQNAVVTRWLTPSVACPGNSLSLRLSVLRPADPLLSAPRPSLSSLNRPISPRGARSVWRASGDDPSASLRLLH